MLRLIISFIDIYHSDSAENLKVLYLQYAKLEEDYGLAKRAMKVHNQAAKTVPNNEKMSMYEIYIARAAEIFGVPKTREIYEQAIESGLPDKDVKVICMKYAKLEKSLGEIDRARAIYNFSSQYADPRFDADFWTKWHDFEVQHDNEDTFREMLRMKRSVSASYNQASSLSDIFDSSTNLLFLTIFIFLRTHFILTSIDAKRLEIEHEETVDTHEASLGFPEEEMAALERQFAPESNNTTSKDGSRKLGFVEENNKDGDEENYSKLGALERIKRQRQGGYASSGASAQKVQCDEYFINTTIYVGGLDPSVRLEDLRSNAEEALLKLHTTDVNTLGLGAVDSQKKFSRKFSKNHL
ncbi:hypothetical protein IFM89_008515 [Coptis chinensis]|uniref:Pre-mRNA-splicing factor Syf1/CRNKL1-like C-terminal HAT-repeats domain-containing protein n=1 Tax=Coptis chinensis TaxID=261450 RepID=A0A835HJ04_9MAGN|nr:hypothetical protein IFM89_008515 [Coptis chinensis]